MYEPPIAVASAAVALVQGIAWRRVTAARGMRYGSMWRSVLLGFLIGMGSLMAGVFGPYGSLGAGLAANLFLGGSAYRSVRRADRVKALVERSTSADPGESSAALTALDGEVERLLRSREKADFIALWVLTITAHVAQAGHREKALAWVLRLDPSHLGRSAAAMQAQIEAALRIGMHDRPGARQALARSPRGTSARWDDALLALETLLDALEGDARAAAERASQKLAHAPKSTAKTMWSMTLAHALASLGETEEARRTLVAMRHEDGEAALQRVVEHAGPASQLAESVLAQQGTYR